MNRTSQHPQYPQHLRRFDAPTTLARMTLPLLLAVPVAAGCQAPSAVTGDPGGSSPQAFMIVDAVAPDPEALVSEARTVAYELAKDSAMVNLSTVGVESGAALQHVALSNNGNLKSTGKNPMAHEEDQATAAHSVASELKSAIRTGDIEGADYVAALRSTLAGSANNNRRVILVTAGGVPRGSADLLAISDVDPVELAKQHPIADTGQAQGVRIELIGVANFHGQPSVDPKLAEAVQSFWKAQCAIATSDAGAASCEVHSRSPYADVAEPASDGGKNGQETTQ